MSYNKSIRLKDYYMTLNIGYILINRVFDLRLECSKNAG